MVTIVSVFIATHGLILALEDDMLKLSSGPGTPPPSCRVPTGSPTPAPTPQLATPPEMLNGVTRISDVEMTVTAETRALMREHLLGRIRYIPGRTRSVAWVAFYGIRYPSLPATLGLRNGDHITSINEVPVNARVFEASLRNFDGELRIVVERRGQEFTLLWRSVP